MSSQLAWLVERQTPQGAEWSTPNYQWTAKAIEAAWFVRREDAELFSWNLSDDTTVTEHCFVDDMKAEKSDNTKT